MSDNIWFLADPHAGHSLAARERGFGDDVEAHDAWIRQMLRRLTTAYPGAVLFLLGDLAFAGWRDRLWNFAVPGLEVHVILGNHDRPHPLNRNGRGYLAEYMSVFRSVQLFDQVREFSLSHFPYDGDNTEDERFAKWRLRDGGRPLLHGHTHSKQKVSLSAKGTLQIHVGVDAWRRPVSLHEVREILHTHQKGTLDVS